jgi:prepilin-type N-terminal cleavage/methylation domain-containing protein
MSFSPMRFRNGHTVAVGRARRGVTMPELIVTMILVGIIGTAFVRLMVGQSHFFDAQSSGRQARSVSRGALNVLMSELRMVPAPNGLIDATASKITVRVPFAWGLICGSTPAATTVSLAPMDSLAFSEGGLTGYAWRDSIGGYALVNAGVTSAPGLIADCVPSQIATLPGGKVRTLQPAPPAAAVPGTPVFLYRRIEYEFKASVAMPGRRALWRKNVATNTEEEIIGPFGAAAAFRFYVDGNNTPQVNPPLPAALGTVRGLELVLTGESDRAAMTTAAPATTTMQTAVFFMNRAP